MITTWKPHIFAQERRISDNWMEVQDGNPLAFRIMERHYSFNDNRYDSWGDPVTKRFVGPGERIVLINRYYGDALFVWRKFIDDSGQTGVNCAVFRNEMRDMRSSGLILEAEEWALDRWGHIRLYTYVDPQRIESRNPGYCFKQAGWNSCGITKKQQLIILEKYI